MRVCVCVCEREGMHRAPVYTWACACSVENLHTFQQNGEAHAASDVLGVIHHAATFIYVPLLVALLFIGGEYHHHYAEWTAICMRPGELRLS